MAIATATGILPAIIAIRIGIIAAAVVVLLLAGLVTYSALHSPAAPAAGPTTSSSAPAPSTSAPPTSTSPSPDVDTLLAQLSQQIDAAGFDHDVAKDLDHRVRDIQRAWDKGDGDNFHQELQHLRDDIHHKGDDGDQGKGGADPAAIQGIDDLITQLLAVAGP